MSELTAEQLVRPLFWFGCSVTIADALTTMYALALLGDNGAEANPVVASMIGSFGLVGGLLLRASIGIAMVSFLCFRFMTGYTPKWMSKGLDFRRTAPYVKWVDIPKWKVSRAALWGVVFMITITATVVGNNLHAIKLIHQGVA